MFETYLGDGVYASFDGWQIWLAANHHENKVIALEPEVQLRLINYMRDIKMKIQDDRDSFREKAAQEETA